MERPAYSVAIRVVAVSTFLLFSDRFSELSSPLEFSLRWLGLSRFDQTLECADAILYFARRR